MSDTTAKKSQIDMGTGSIPKLLAKLALPAVLAQIVHLMYNIVDRIFIGHIPEIGASALTGVGLFTPLLMFMTAFAMMAGSGGAPLAAIALGEKNKEKAEKIIANSFTLLLIFAVFLSASLFFLAEPLLRMFGASDATLPYALPYARIYVLGSVFVLIFMGMNTFITTQGFAKISMLSTVIGALINIVLDPILIFVFKMGVQGAAIATIFSQAVSSVWILHFLTGKKTILKLRPAYMKLEKKIILPVVALGISTFVMLLTEAILSISFTSSLSRYGGDLAVGSMTIITSLNQLVQMPLQGIAQGGQPIISFNYGAGNSSRVKKAFYTQFGVCVTYAVVFWLLIIVTPSTFAGIFTTSEALKEYCVWSMRIYMAVVFTNGFQLACQQSFMALGQAKISLFLAVLRKVVLLIPLIFILPQFLADKVFAVFLAEPISDFVAAAITTIAFMSQFGKILKKKEAEIAAKG